MAGDGGALDVLRHLVLPAVTTALGPAAIITRMVRSSIREALERPHVRVARAKGLPRGVLLRRHVILNALPPIVTITGLQLGYLIGGALADRGGVRLAGARLAALRLHHRARYAGGAGDDAADRAVPSCWSTSSWISSTCCSIRG